MEKQISIEQGLQAIIGKLGLRNVDNLPTYDILLWMTEALGHIGTLMSIENVTKEIQVENFRGQWPEDLYAPIRLKDGMSMKSEQGGFLTSKSAGVVTLEYQRFVSDDRGFLMIPNTPSVQDALTWYVASFLSIQDLLPNKQLNHAYCDNMWKRYCKQARAEGISPTLDQWERMVNIYNRFIPKRFEYENEFRGNDVREQLVTDKANAPLTKITNSIL